MKERLGPVGSTEPSMVEASSTIRKRLLSCARGQDLFLYGSSFRLELRLKHLSEDRVAVDSAVAYQANRDLSVRGHHDDDLQRRSINVSFA